MAPGSVVAQPVGVIGAGTGAAQLLTAGTGAPFATPFRLTVELPITWDEFQVDTLDEFHVDDDERPSDDEVIEERPETVTAPLALELSTIPQPEAMSLEPLVRLSVVPEVPVRQIQVGLN